MSEKKKYNCLENVLQQVLKKSISLDSDEVKTNNAILKGVLDQLIASMKEKNPIFKMLFKEIFYGGSYYDGLKTSKPEEFDLDLLLKFPKKYNPVLVTHEEHPGFVTIKFNNEEITGENELKIFMDGDNFITSKVLQWMESLVTKTLQEFPQSASQSVFSVNGQTTYVKITKNGPAFMMKVTTELNGTIINFDVDLVPCIVCDYKLWPKAPFRKNTIPDKPNFFLVPKTPKLGDEKITSKYWRISFQQQEQVIITGYKTLKPAIKLLKKLRDKLQHKPLASYYIKTVCLWEVTKRDKSFWENSLSYVFMEIFKSFLDCLIDKKLPFFWNEENNLIGNIADVVLENYKNRWQRIYSEINRTLDPLCVAKLYFSKEEIEALDNELQLFKKDVKIEGTEIALVGQNNAQIKANIGNININSGITDSEYSNIMAKLNHMQKESKQITNELSELKQENKQMAKMMAKLCEGMDVLAAHFERLNENFDKACKNTDTKEEQEKKILLHCKLEEQLKAMQLQ